jgi:hypothetical protein
MKVNTYEFFSALGGVVNVVKSADATKGLKNIGSLVDITKGLPNINIKLPSLPTKLPDLPTKLPGLPTKLPDLPTKLPDLGDLGDVGKGLDIGKNSDALESAIKADKSLTSKTIDIIKKGGSNVADFAKAHPKLVLAGLAVSSVGIYAAVNGLTFGQATEKLGKMTASEVAEVVKATGSVAAQVITEGVAPAVIEVAGAAGSAAGSTAGSLIGSTLDGILNPIAKSLGISKSQLLYIISGIVIFFILIWLYRMFNSSRYDDYYNKYFSFGFKNVNLHNLESLGSSKYNY